MTDAAAESPAGAAEVRERLWRMAADHARMSGYEFAPDGEGYFRYQARVAARRMLAEDRAGEWEQATRNTTRLVSEMTFVAREMGFRELHEPALGQALRRLCPLWPFC